MYHAAILAGIGVIGIAAAQGPITTAPGGACGCPTSTHTVEPTGCPTYNCPLAPECITYSPTVSLPPLSFPVSGSPPVCDFIPVVTSTASCSSCQTGCRTTPTTTTACYTATETIKPTGCVLPPASDGRPCTPPDVVIVSTTTVPPNYCACPTTGTSSISETCPTSCPTTESTFWSTVTAPF